jgi:hypothetical protein
MQACRKEVTCWDHLKRPCQRTEGHIPGHCNPFSNSHPDELENTSEETTKLYKQVLQAAGLVPSKLVA